MISKIPGGAAAGYWGIAIFELALALTFLSSLFVSPLLAVALTGSLFMFGFLCLGLRLVSDFQGSANMFIYFAATLISLFVIS